VRRVSSFGAVCLLSGVLMAGLAFPVVGGLTVLAASGAQGFDDLPSELATPSLPEHSVLYDASGTTVIAILRGAEDRVNVPIADIPQSMQKAIIAIEDSRFYRHHGVDLKGIARAIVKNNEGGSVQGASTLTQQYVKNVRLEQASNDEQRAAATKRSTERKIREARYALQLERILTKDQILERYLNIAYFGEGAYGVGTASTHYFGVGVQQLTVAQAALLAGLVNNPTGFDPINHPGNAMDRRLAVLTAMREQHYITPQEQTAAATTPLLPLQSAARHVRDPDSCAGTVAPFFCDYVRTKLLVDQQLGQTQAEREDKLFNGGLRIRTTLDLQAQKAAQQAVASTIKKADRVAATEVVVEPGTGRVLAIAVNRTYGTARTGRTDTKVRLADTPTFQGGSTFKMFTLAAALKQGVRLGTRITAPPCYRSKIFENPDPTGRNCYRNAADSEGGNFDLVSGTWESVNTFFVQLEERVGVQSVIDTAVSLGIPRVRFRGLGTTSGSVTLGAVPDGVAPLELANAYATLAAHGVRCYLRSVLYIQQRDGSQLIPLARPCEQVIDPAVADTVTSVLEGVLTQPRATAAGKGIGRPAAGKTGTLDDQHAAWFVGFTPQLSAAVVLGDPSASSLPLGTVEGVYPVFGGTLPALIWQKSMTAAHLGRPVLDLPPPAATTPVRVLTPATPTATATSKSKGGRKHRRP
jgi:membrane peptidoglycan carboxypeptidase